MSKATCTSITSRRALLAAVPAAALSAPLAALASPTAVSAGPNPDAALLALGRRFDAVHLEWEARSPAFEAANNAWGAALRNLARTRGSEPTPDEVYSRLFAEADPEGLMKQEEEFCEAEVYPLTEAILAAPAATVEGLAVKARALTFTIKPDIWEAEDAEDLGWDEQVLRGLVEAVLRLARADRFGRSLAGEAAHV